jgi:hypothetical protein
MFNHFLVSQNSDVILGINIASETRTLINLKKCLLGDTENL